MIPQPSVERLQAMGDWLTVNGESVYGTAPGPVQGLEGCRSTAKGDKVYLHVFDWPEGGQIRIPGLQRPAGAYLLSDASRAALPITEGEGEMIVDGPADAPDPIDTVVVLLTK